MAGRQELEVGEWRAATRYDGCSPAAPQVRWLWEAVSAMAQLQRRAFLAFVTGSSALPVGGFSALRGFNGGLHPFTVTVVAVEGDARLPRASTCFNHLFLPAFTSAEALAASLATAISGANHFDEGAIRRG